MTNEPSSGKYFLRYSGGIVPSVFSQFNFIYVAENDLNRSFYVYGKEGVQDIAYQDKIEEITVYDSYGNQKAYVYSDTREGKNTIASLTTGCYTTRIDNFNIDNTVEESFTIKAETLGGVVCENTFKAIKIDNRELIINEYSYANNTSEGKKYDILEDEYGAAPRLSIKGIFAEANIDVIFPSSNEFEVTEKMPLTSDYKNELFDYAEDVSSELKNNWNNDKYIVLIGMDNYNYTGLNIGGTTLTKKFSSGEYGASVCYIFQERLEGGSDNILDEKVTTRGIAHELGHARGKLLPPLEEGTEFGYIKYLTDNELHATGHYGTHFEYCIMSYFFSDHESRKISAENPHFCEGHIQMLLNTSFKLGE